MTKLSKDTIKSIFSLASLAPSSHNTQPWQVQRQNEGFLITHDPSTHLKVGDPDFNELCLSMGCFLESVVRAAKSEGYDTVSQLSGNKTNPEIKIVFKPSTKEGIWRSLLENRRSDRRHYENESLDKDFIKQLRQLSYGNSFFLVAESKDDIEYLSEKTKEATFAAMSSADFRSELSSWVRNNWTKKPDGMPGYTQGIPGPVSLFAKHVVKHLPITAKDQAKKDSSRVRESAAIGIIYINGKTAEDLINAGRLYQLACLEAEKNSIRTSAVSSAIIHKDSSEEIVERFGIEGIPVALLRFGKAPRKDIRKTPRRKFEDFFSF